MPSKARGALRLGLFSLLLLTQACARPDIHRVAGRADVASASGIYTWLADHDPSAVVLVGPDAAIVSSIAPDAMVLRSRDVPSGCARAKAAHALLAVIAMRGSKARDAANDCGYAVFHDRSALVIAPM